MSEQLHLELEVPKYEKVENQRFVIGANIKVYNPAKIFLNTVYKDLKVQDPKYKHYLKQKKKHVALYYGIEKYIKCYSYDTETEILTIPFGMFKKYWSYIKTQNYTIDFNELNYDISIKGLPCPITLRDYQEPAVSEMVKAKTGVLVSPCGSGKTIMGIEIIHRIGKKFLWLTHTQDLLNQTYDAFKSLYPDIKLGKIQGGNKKDSKTFGEDGTIAMVQSLAKINPEEYAENFEVVVCDECAHAVGSVKDSGNFAKILNNVKARYKFGLTATPSRSDDLIKSMYMHLGVNKKGEYKPMYQVDKSVIPNIQAQHFRIDLPFEINGEIFVSKKSKDIDFTKLISYLVEQDDRTNFILENILKLSLDGRKQVVLSGRKEHAKKMQEYLLSRGLKAVYVDGNSKAKERKEILAEKSDWQVLCATYSLLKEGNNIPSLDTLHLATPLVSKASIVQSVGRIERICDNKKQPIVFDYVDNLEYLEVAYFRRAKSLKERF
jgi:superfamily II DNA or RNA helicase